LLNEFNNDPQQEEKFDRYSLFDSLKLPLQKFNAEITAEAKDANEMQKDKEIRYLANAGVQKH